MKVVNLTYSDYANFAYMNCQALRAVGVDCYALTATEHKFNYANSSEVASYGQMNEMCKDADLIQIFHSAEVLHRFIHLNSKRVFVYHTGTPYRMNPDKMNELWNPVAERIFIDSPEFYILGGKNVTYIATAIDTDKIPYSPSLNKKNVFAHYPSIPEVKGTRKIMQMMEKHNVDFKYSTERVSSEDNLKRMRSCDVYIELFAPMQDDKIYGSFGVTAFEASAMGKQVITNSVIHQVYTHTYGSDELLVANTEEEFHLAVETARKFKPKDGERIRQWIEDKHSLKATGNYLLQFL
jgi:hypothetical protein